MSWLEFFPQCCDSQQYLELGERCAESMGSCYDSLRPLGGGLWFSIPFRLGLPPESLILINLLLFLISVSLSSYVFSRLAETFSSNRQPTWNWLHRVFLVVSSALVHYAFFRPVMFNSIMDAPAGFFILIAIWLILLYQIRPSCVLLGAAGALFGLAAFSRAFYLYPTFLVMLAFFVLWRRNRRLCELIFFIALIPIAIQFASTYQRHGYIRYLDKKAANLWTSIHLKSDLIGYDTIMPLEGHEWRSNLEVSDGLAGLCEKRIRLTALRAEFYLGTYSPRAYLTVSDEYPDSSPSDMRIWSKYFLLLNLLAMAFSLSYFAWLRNVVKAGGLIAVLFSMSVLAEGLVIIPEQRFILVFSTISWLTSLEMIMMLFVRHRVAGGLFALLGRQPAK